jgi:uroporphyrinogen decarboxylase
MDNAHVGITHRERFDRLFDGKPVDRAPFVDYMGGCNYPSCMARWKAEGLDLGADRDAVRRMMGFDYARGYFIGVKPLANPEFEVETIRSEGGRIYRRNRWGALEVQQGDMELMPITLEGPVKDRYTWEAYKERLLDGAAATRFPEDFDGICREAANSGLPVYAGDLPVGFFGGPRELCGFDGLIYMFSDDPQLLSEILDALCGLWIDIYAEVQRRVRLDYFFIWEDMCFKGGPLIGPALFREFLLPRYKLFADALRAGGCRHIVVDSDGDERPLVPLWLEGGVNIVFPWETQFGLDITEVRGKYPALGMIGGIDKHALEYTRGDIDAELEKIPYMLERGYFIPCCDHGVTNRVSWDNYRYFCERLRDLVYKHPPQV